MPTKRRPAPSILVLGDISLDILARLEEFKGLGGDYLVPALEPHCGGVGANVALALAKWGASVRLLGCVGRDWFGEQALGILGRAGIDTAFVRRTGHALTGLFFIAVSADGQRTMFGSRGANVRLENVSIRKVLAGVRALHVVGYSFLTPAAAEVAGKLMEEARKRKLVVSFDVGMAPAREIPLIVLQAARKASILFTSIEEAQALTGLEDKWEAFAGLEKNVPAQVVLKLGSEGCMLRDESRAVVAPAFRVSALDTTGAGDAFAAAFLRACLDDWPAAEAALLANGAGAAAACELGAGEMMPEPRRVLSLLQSHTLDEPWEKVRQRVVARLSKELQASRSKHS